MVEHWSSCLSGMQFSTRDQVSLLSLFTILRLHFYGANNWLLQIIDNVQMMTVITLMMVMVIDRTMTATSRAAVLRRIKQDGGSTGETTRANANALKIENG